MRNRNDGGSVKVREDTRIVEVTLMASCITVFLHIRLVYTDEF